MADIDLDAELALFEEEIKNVPIETPAGDDGDAGSGAATALNDASAAKPPPAKRARTSQGPGAGDAGASAPARPKAVIVAQSAAAKAKAEAKANAKVKAEAEAEAEAKKAETKPLPAWQREMQERDAMRMQTAAKGAGAIGSGRAAEAKAGWQAGSSGATYAGSVGSAGGAGGSAGGSVQAALGAWTWDGWQWVWDAKAVPGPNGVAVGDATTAGVVGVGSVGGGGGEGRSGKWKGKGKSVRSAAGKVWVDPSLNEWPEDDFRIFVGDLAPDATDEELEAAFGKYESFNKGRVVVDRRSGEGKGFGFVSFAKGDDMVRALREMNGKYVGSRPVKLKKSDWQKRNMTDRHRQELKVFKSTGLVEKSKRRK